MTLSDRLQLRDLLSRYLWCMDTGDAKGLIETFTADGVVKDVAGTMWGASRGGAAGFAARYIDPPGRLGGQHWVQSLAIERTGADACTMTSYWFSVYPPSDGEGSPAIRATGRYIDLCTRVDGHWLFREKRIDPWNDETVPEERV